MTLWIDLDDDRISLSRFARPKTAGSSIEILERIDLKSGHPQSSISHGPLVFQPEYVLTKLMQCSASSRGSSFKKSLRNLGSIRRVIVDASSSARSPIKPARNRAL
jgi:hypothetical protein